VRRFLPELIDLIWNRQINPGKVYDLELPFDQPAQVLRSLHPPLRRPLLRHALRTIQIRSSWSYVGEALRVRRPNRDRVIGAWLGCCEPRVRIPWYRCDRVVCTCRSNTSETSMAITLDRYSHVMPTVQSEAVRRLDGVLSGM
jgi:hypothetical protein